MYQKPSQREYKDSVDEFLKFIEFIERELKKLSKGPSKR
jgi:hypothetical protein